MAFEPRVGFHVEWFHQSKLHSGTVTRLWSQLSTEPLSSDDVAMATIEDDRGYVTHVEVGRLRDSKKGCEADATNDAD
jgi:hypothetical protein